MKHYRQLSLMTAILLTLPLIACGETATTTDETATATASDTTTSPSSEYTDPGIDFGGETFTVAAHVWDTPWQLANYNEVFIDEENGDFLNDAIVKRTQLIEEQFNLNLDIYPIAERNKPTELVTAALAGDDVYKFGLVMSASLPTMLGTEGMLVDLNSVPTLDFTHSWWDQNAIDELNLFGVQYAALGDVNLYAKGGPVVNFFNKEMIESNGLENPYELVRSGKWTLDKMIEMATAVSRDLNSNGVPDIDDCFGFMGETDSMFYLLTGCDVRFSEHDDEKIEITIMSERSVDAISKISDLLNDKHVTMFSSDYQAGYSNVFFELLIPTLGNNRALFFSNNLLASLNMRDMEVDFGILPLPKYNEEQENYVSFSNTWFNDYVIIPSTNTDLERTGEVIEAMCYYSQQYVVPAFIDNAVMNKTIRDDDSGEMIELVFDTMEYDIALIFNWGGIQGTVTGMKSKSGQSYASVYEASKAAILAAVDETTEELKNR